MPQISKIRIANFRYNDGRRLIADELYNLTSAQSTEALNTLINLKNGGGKSVLVQLILQPLIPRAKVAGRNLAGFFTRPGDHSFVVLEWFKDNSGEKLLTGIALASAESLNEVNDEARGNNVKYYTFSTAYREESDRYSIVNLPLSAKVNGRYQPADYARIREAAKKSNGRLVTYSADERTKWWDHLKSYGIYPATWEMIRRLNSEEGGLTKYFGTFKNSDQLLNNLLIKTIEEKLNIALKDDDSLVTMLINYARRYAAKADRAEEKKRYERYIDGLTLMRPQAEALWNLADQSKMTLSNLFGLENALNKREKAVNEALATNENQLSVIKEKLRLIEYERRSLVFYQKEAECTAKCAAYTSKDAAYQSAIKERDDLEKKLKYLECARLAAEITQLKQEITALDQAINAKEENSDNVKLLNSLKYSIKVQTTAELKLVSAAVAKREVRLEELNKKTDAERTKLAGLTKAYAKQDALTIQAKTKYQEALNESDKLILKLKLALQRDLTNSYSAGALKALEAGKQEEIVKLEQEIATLKARKAALEEELNVLIPQKINELLLNNRQLESAKEQLTAELKNYQAFIKEIKMICAVYSLPLDSYYEAKLIPFLRQEKEEKEAYRLKALQEYNLLQQELKAIRQGNLHVSAATCERIAATGVRYQTVESYLFSLIKEEKLTTAACAELLKAYPLLAYGIIMEEKERAKFFATAETSWLATATPLFDFATLDNILKGVSKPAEAIAFYAEEYFLTPDKYTQQLVECQKAKENESLRLKAELATLEKELRLVQTFNYPKDYEIKLQEKLTALISLRKENECTIAELKLKKKELSQEAQTLNLNNDNLNQTLNELKIQIHYFSDLKERIVNEEETYRVYQETKALLNNLNREKEMSASLYQTSLTASEEAKLKLEEVRKQKALLEDVSERYAHAPVADIIAEPWAALESRYETLSAQFDKEIATIRQDKMRKAAECQAKEAALQAKDVAREMYQALRYTPKQEKYYNNELESCKLSLAKKTKEREDCLQAKAQAENELAHAQKDLELFGSVALAKSAIQGDFAYREETLAKESNTLTQKNKELKKIANKIQTILGRFADRHYLKPHEIRAIELADDFLSQYETLVKKYDEEEKSLTLAAEKLKNDFRDFLAGFKDEDITITKSLKAMLPYLERSTGGDNYYTFYEHLVSNCDIAAKTVAQIAADLKGVVDYQRNLVNACLKEGERIYEGLKRLERSSSVRVYAEREKKKMIVFENLPPQVDNEVARTALAHELEIGTTELIAGFHNLDIHDEEVKKKAQTTVGSNNLFRKYCGVDSLSIKAYKIDQNPLNAGYRSWEKTQVNNSGAEKFVIYFAVILSLMNFTRNDSVGLNERYAGSTLILDNPFGATSSKHILEPMFTIAKHFRVQLICLSDIDKVDVTNCFELVIKAVIKKMSGLAGGEILTHTQNEAIEHGFYRREQLNLLASDE